MTALVLLLIGLLGETPVEYLRPLGAKFLDQPTLDSEGFGQKKAFVREDDGLRIRLAAGEPETGWRTPQTFRFGGDFVITVDLLLKALPKPAQEDGAAFGISLAFQDINQPEFTFLRQREPNGHDVYHPFDKGLADPMQAQQQMMMQMRRQQQMMMMGGQGPAQPPKPPRRTYPASGDLVHLELRREGQTLTMQVNDVASGRLRYLGQQFLGPNDIMALKLFASNRNGAEPIDVLIKDISIRAARVNGLGTAVRSVYGVVAYGDPTDLKDGVLTVGGPPKTPPPAAATAATPPGAQPATPGQIALPPGAISIPVAPGAVAPTPVVAAPAAIAVAQPVMVAVGQVNGGMVVVRQVRRQAGANGEIEMVAGGQMAQSPDGSPIPQPPPSKEPKAKLPLDEIESIRFDRNLATTGRFIGQSPFDFTMPHPDAPKDEPKPADAKKDEPKKVEPKPAEAKKDEPKTTVAMKVEAKPADLKKVEAKPADAKPTDAKPDEPKPAEAKPDEPKPADKVDDLNAPPPGTVVVKAVVVPKVEPKKNGIRDLQLSLAGLRPSPIRQITVMTQTDKGQQNYQLDTTGSPSWPIVVRRSGVQGWADLFLEPPPGDCFGKPMTVTIQYQDNQQANVQIKAEAHTDPKLAVDPKEPAIPQPDVWVFLSGEEKLYGKLESVVEDSLKLATPWGDKLAVPMTRIVGFQVALLDPKESAASFAKRLKARGSEDLLLARTRDGEVIAIAGVLEGSEGDRLLFRYQGKTRKLAIEQVEGVVMANRPDPAPPDSSRSTFAMPGGLSLTGKWKSIEPNLWKVETPWGQELSLPAADVQGVRFRGGKVTYLSDLDPTKVEEAPFFGRKFSWRRDVSLLGEPLKMDGRTFERGVAVHSKSSLTYDLNARYATFEALVGFDEAARSKGRVDCRVFADGKEIFANPDLRADSAPIPLKLSVEGAEQLRLLIDFGKDQDTGDRVIWANARLYRK